MIETGLYIHIPFCEKRCNYCNFFSSVKKENIVEKYVEELCKELRLISQKNKNISIKTIYLGGGTPSLLNISQLDEIFNTIYNNYSVNAEEITIEINPNSSLNLEEYPQMGINRVSVGVQSTDNILLKKLGRIHTASEAISTLEKASNIFNNVSADLIIGVDDRQDVVKETNSVKDFVKHLSCYMLTIEKNTKLYKDINANIVSVATEDSVISQYNDFVNYARQCGFLQYETSNFCKKGYESKHNSSYWNLMPYIGVGASAHSYFGGVRYYNESNLDNYVKGRHSGNDKIIIERESSFFEDKLEYVMLSLRTIKGIDLLEYREKFHSSFILDYSNGVNKMKEYLKISDNFVSILPQYFLLQNTIISSVLDC